MNLSLLAFFSLVLYVAINSIYASLYLPRCDILIALLWPYTMQANGENKQSINIGLLNDAVLIQSQTFKSGFKAEADWITLTNNNPIQEWSLPRHIPRA